MAAPKPADPIDLSEELYDRCNKAALKSEESTRKTFTQAELLELCDSEPLDHISNAATLLPIISKLSKQALIIALKLSTGSCWSLRPREAAKQVCKLGREEKMVYEVIEAAHKDGIWIRHIKNKTGIKDSNSMDKLLQKLSRLDLIKNIKSVKQGNQKTYMLYHLAPSDEVTGGTFYDAGEIDESLVEELKNLVVFHVRQMSWGYEKRKRVKREESPVLVRDDEEQTVAGTGEPRDRKKRKRDSTVNGNANDIEDLGATQKTRSHKPGYDPETDTDAPTQLLYPAGHIYPTASSIHSFITTNNFIRAVKANSLTIDEVQNIVNVLVWDEKLEVVNGGYRTVRGVQFKPPGLDGEDEEEETRAKRGNGLIEAPCGRCPVMDVCSTGGPVNAAGCEYFTKWLEQGVAA